MNIVFCDGSCLGNPGPGGWAVLMLDSNVETIKTGGAAQTTNNRMEIIAACEGIELAGKCELYTDSKYLVIGITQWLPNWKRKNWRTASGGEVKNIDLWRRVDALCANNDVSWNWIKGHNNHTIHDRVDQLARDVATGFR